jgi:hypothetical protein
VFHGIVFQSGRRDVDQMLRILFQPNATSNSSSLFRVEYFPENITPWGPTNASIEKQRSHSTGHWFELYSQELDLSVIVVAGTDIGKINDVLEDVKMWIEPVLLKLLSAMFPTVRLWPQYLTSLLIETMHSTVSAHDVILENYGLWRWYWNVYCACFVLFCRPDVFVWL